MIIGIPKETKLFEKRVALISEHVKLLVDYGHIVLVEKGAGEGAGFNDNEYIKNGAKIVDRKEVYKAKMIVRVKRPQIKTLKTNQILLGYLHVEKGENPPLLRSLISKKITAFAYHLFFDEKGNRLINLGYEAGVVGMYEGLRLYGMNLYKKNKIKTDFLDLPSVWELKSEEMIIKQLEKIKNFPHSLKIYLLGNGLVASGCRRILNVIDLPYLVLSRKETAEIENYLPKVDILVNATYWLPSEPHIVERKHLKLMKKTSIICDISCEEHGAIETTVEKTWGNPTYEVDGILHFAVGNLPSALSHDASVHLSNMIIKYVKEIAKGNYNFTGLITKDGKYLYKLPTKK